MSIGNLDSGNPFIDTRVWSFEQGSYTPHVELLEKDRGYWVRVKQPGINLRFPHDPQAGKKPLNTLWKLFCANAKHKLDSIFSGTSTASASSDDHPPAPMSGFSEQNDIEGSGGGCVFKEHTSLGAAIILLLIFLFCWKYWLMPRNQ